MLRTSTGEARKGRKPMVSAPFFAGEPLYFNNLRRFR
jgi:hypothetical protein